MSCRLPEIRHALPGVVAKRRLLHGGIGFAIKNPVSGLAVSKALHDRFEAIRCAELDRLRKKLGALSDEDRRRVDAITADIIHAIARVPAQALARDARSPMLEAVVRLFGLTPDRPEGV